MRGIPWCGTLNPKLYTFNPKWTKGPQIKGPEVRVASGAEHGDAGESDGTLNLLGTWVPDDSSRFGGLGV